MKHVAYERADHAPLPPMTLHDMVQDPFESLQILKAIRNVCQVSSAYLDCGNLKDLYSSKAEMQSKSADAPAEKIPQQGAEPADLAKSREALIADAEKNIKDPAELKKFKDNLQTLEARAKKDGITGDQLAQMYSQVDRLFTTNNPSGASPEQRVVLAEQIMGQAANPKNVRQGNSQTCGDACAEAAAYTQHPEAAAKLVTDVALTGQYTAPDGSVIKVSNKPYRQSHNADGTVKHEPGPDERSYASQLFQVTAENIALRSRVPKLAHPSYYEDEQGEHAYETKNGVKKKIEVDLDVPSVAAAYKSITGSDMTVIDQEPTPVEGSLTGNTPVVQSEADLGQVLANAKLPAMILISPDNAPLNAPGYDSTGTYADKTDFGHYVLVTGYQAGPPPKIEIYNTQGKSFPFGSGGEISLHDLYLATLSRPDEIKALQADLAADKKSGTKETWKEVALIRLEMEEGIITFAEAKRELDQIDPQLKKKIIWPVKAKGYSGMVSVPH
jgi:hypothetical protein